jgi:hypothetical protein
MSTKSVMSHFGRCCGYLAAIRGSVICALVVIFLDVVISGCYLFSAMVCPIWCIVGAVRAALQQPGPGVAAARVLIPIVTGLLAFGNYSAQRTIAMGNAERVIEACERYREAHGAYPERLSELVPRYLNSVPRAKYCCSWGEFRYFEGPPAHMLLWYEIPPFGRRIYNFERGAWRYLD